jgi:hypothetical protein
MQLMSGENFIAVAPSPCDASEIFKCLRLSLNGELRELRDQQRNELLLPSLVFILKGVVALYDPFSSSVREILSLSL